MLMISFIIKVSITYKIKTLKDQVAYKVKTLMINFGKKINAMLIFIVLLVGQNFIVLRS